MNVAGLEKKVKSRERPKFLYACYILPKNKINQLHAVSRTHQDRQREHSVNTFRSPLSTEFWGHYVLSDETQRRKLQLHRWQYFLVNLINFVIYY